MPTANRAGALDLRILGPVEIEAGSRVWSPGGRRQRKLLALLVLNANESIPVDRLVDVLWDEPPHSARQQIHNATNQLRSALPSGIGGASLTFVQGGYRLDAPTECIDVFRFRAAVREAALLEAAGSRDEEIKHLRRALDQWRGPALAGLGGLRLASVAAGLDEERLAATELLVAARLYRGEAGALVGELTALVAEYPLRESLRASLMTALHREGRQADALAVYEEGRRQLADELGLDPGPQLRAAHERVLLGDPATGASSGRAQSATLLATRAGTEDDHTEASPAHCYLPGDTTEFSGREAEVLQLMQDAQRRTATASVISSIGGMGGVGKTALAVHVAHTLAARYPDGQYFVDLQGFSTIVDPLTPLQALQILLRECATPPERIPADLAGRSALWRAQIAGRRAILLIDNALDAAQVRPLLPGTADMLVLITSRRRLSALEGAIPLSLEVLPQQDAIDLFVQIVGGKRVAAEPEAVQAVAELCGRLPLAIRIAAARLRDRTSWSVADLVEKLRDQRHRTRMLATGDRDVMAVLAVSYRYLTPDQRRVFRLLGLLPGADFSADAVAAMTGTPVDDAEGHLDALFDDNLLLQSSVSRYHFHDLVRDCSHSLSQQHETAADQQSAILRLLDYYLAVAHTLCTDLAIGPFQFIPDAGDVAQVEAGLRPLDRNQALAALEAEHRNFIAAARLARQAGHHAHVWQIACALQPYFSHLNYTGDALELFETAVDAARSVGDLRGELISLTALALACRAQTSSTRARALLAEALAVSRQCGDAAAEQFVLTLLDATELNSSVHP